MSIDPMAVLKNQQITDSALLTGLLGGRSSKNTTGSDISSGTQGYSNVDFSRPIRNGLLSCSQVNLQTNTSRRMMPRKIVLTIK